MMITCQGDTSSLAIYFETAMMQSEGGGEGVSQGTVGQVFRYCDGDGDMHLVECMCVFRVCVCVCVAL